MYKQFTIISILLATLFAACAPKDNWVEVKSNDSTISLMLPPDMHTLKGFNNYAILQYGNLDNSLSVIVIADTISAYNALIDNYISENPDSAAVFSSAKGFDGYCSMVISNLKAEAQKFDVSENTDTTVNSFKIRAFAYNAKYDTDKSYIRLAIYEGKVCYYQVFAMIKSTRADEFDAQMKRIVYSLNGN